MALSKEFVREVFSGAGADPTKTAEAVEKVVSGHVASIDALREEINDLKSKLKEAQTESGKAQEVKKKYDDLCKQVEADNKAREGKDYDALKKEFDDYKADIQAKAEKSAKEKAFRALLSDMKVSDKGVSLILKYQGVNGIELDEDGKLKDAPALRKAVKEDWSDYISTVETKGADTKTPPGSDSGAGKMTKADIMKIKDTSERQKAIAENPELFGIQ